jgi:hypothetical protein
MEEYPLWAWHLIEALPFQVGDLVRAVGFETYVRVKAIVPRIEPDGCLIRWEVTDGIRIETRSYEELSPMPVKLSEVSV